MGPGEGLLGDVDQLLGRDGVSRVAGDPGTHAGVGVQQGAQGVPVGLDRGVDQVVVLDITKGAEIARADTGSPVQSVLFPTPGFGRDVYLCSFAGISRVEVVPR